MRYGIIGTGWIAKSFIDGARMLCNADIVSVYSRTSESGKKFAADNGIERVYTDLNEFARSEMDAVYVASPNALHFRQSKLMLENGKHVICEKPITVEPEELALLQELAHKKGLIYIEAIMYMFNPARQLLRNSLEKTGKITSAHFDFSQLSSKYPAYLRGELPNIFNPKLATGSLMDLGVYCVYPAVDLFGMPEKIISAASFLDTGADSSGSVALLYGDKTVTLTYSKVGQDRAGSQIMGDEGTIMIESISKLVNMKFVDNNGNSAEIIGDVPKEKLMGYEALAFEKFINGENLEYYTLAKETALKTSTLMKEIRRQSGIEFDI